jgi:4-alpha-glucanotransferase
MGPGAFRFAEFLRRSGQKLWQVLPLNPTRIDSGNSPYHSASAFAGNPLFVSPDLLVRDCFLDETEVCMPPGLGFGGVDYRTVTRCKEGLLDRAFTAFRHRGRGEFDDFCGDNAGWLEDHALFSAAQKKFHGRQWDEWPARVRDRDPHALRGLGAEIGEDVERERFRQYLFYRQWGELRSFCHDRGVRIVGDLPIYPTRDSADLWANQGLFKLGEDRQPLVVAGVPPDYFSESGQLWGNPVYDWDALRESGFQWWRRRFEHNLGLFDLLRIDHFRGLVAYWEVPAGEKTSVNGAWRPVPSEELFTTLLGGIDARSLIAEDLGTITPDVTAVRRRFHLPGMKVLLFAFGDDLGANPYLPHNHEKHCVVYTGTHDNNTVRGWFEHEAGEETLARLFRYLGRETDRDRVHWDLVRLAMSSVANTVLLPMQDLLGLGVEGRMNLPAKPAGNWTWRLDPQGITPGLEAALLEVTETFGRFR